MRQIIEGNCCLAWAKFRSVKEMRQDLLNKISNRHDYEDFRA